MDKMMIRCGLTDVVGRLSVVMRGAVLVIFLMFSHVWLIARPSPSPFWFQAGSKRSVLRVVRLFRRLSPTHIDGSGVQYLYCLSIPRCDPEDTNVVEVFPS